MTNTLTGESISSEIEYSDLILEFEVNIVYYLIDSGDIEYLKATG